VSIIREGRTVETGTLAELRHLTRTSITAETQRPVTGLDAVDGVYDVRVDGLHTRCEVDTSAIDGVLRHLLTFGITSLTSTPPTLEELFLRHYGDELAREGENHRRAESGTRTP
jgi:ABC-2 type transport system ATP-binding protein